jgi:hypothetical protein
MPTGIPFITMDRAVYCYICDRRISSGIEVFIPPERNHPHCRSCAEREYVVCDGCGRVLHRWELHNAPGETSLCVECFREEWRVCRYCNIIIPAGSARELGGGLELCEVCYTQHSSPCEMCGEITVRRSHGPGDRAALCHSCWEETRCIHPYDYSPLLNFEGTPWDNLFMGFELEIEVGDQDRELVAYDLVEFLDSVGLKNRFYMKHDGSLQNGFEVVSHPATYSIWKTQQIPELLKWLVQRGCLSHDPGTCGLHVHLSRAFFSDSQINRIKCFFDENWGRIELLSRRRGNFRYCQREYFERGDTLFGKPQNGRHTAVNVTRTTVEIRVFRGTLNHRTFVATLQFCHAIAHYAKQNHFGSWRDFCYWVQKTGRDHLWEYLQELKLVEEKDNGDLRGSPRRQTQGRSGSVRF